VRFPDNEGHAGKQRRAIDEDEGPRLAPTTVLVDAVRPQARTRATYSWPSLAMRPVAISSIVMTSQPVVVRQVAAASFAWCGRAVTPARTKAVITHATLLLGSARRHVPDGNWTAIAALRPRTGSWDSYDHEPSGPLVSPIARRTFLD